MSPNRSAESVNRLTTIPSVAIVGTPPTRAFDVLHDILRRHSVTAVQLPEKRILYMVAELRAGERSTTPAPLLFLFDLLTPFRYDWRDILRRLRHEDQNVPLVVLADSPAPQTIDDAMRAGADELLYEPELSFPNLVWQRIGGLIELAKPSDANSSEVSARNAVTHSPSPALSIAAPDLRAPSGRLDATRIAKRLGVPVARLAALVGVSRQALNQTPDSPGIQDALHAIARTLHVLDNSLQPDDQQKWLRTSRVNLDRKTPLDAIMGGRADTVARMLESASEIN
jgi:CheY-like chemotaxis protein